MPASLPPPTSVPLPIISRFGDWHGAGGVPRPWQHAGIDIRAPVGTPVLAAADGEVLRADAGRITGKMVLLAHAEDVTTVYMHLSEIWVRVGQWVRRGEPLGRSGMTGNATTPHLHFGVCRRPGGHCGARIGAGWDDPDRYWVDGNPCYDAGRAYPPEPLRFVFPVRCGDSA
jgi:murein DD-endopeptidase MepM/ murein hydrolase activator NlpD